MPLFKEIMGGGLSSGQAVALNGQFGTLAAAGTNQGNAAAIIVSNTVVTGASGTNGVRLPACQPGESVQIINNSASSLLVYPPTGAAIVVPGTGMGSANAAYTETTFAVCLFTCWSATQWGVNKSA